MSKVRKAAVAGAFYPENPEELSALVESYIAVGKSDGRVPRAIISPHAGFMYSGNVAGEIYGLVAKSGFSPRVVVLMGPSHRYPMHVVAGSTAEFFETPLGKVKVASELMKKLQKLPQVELIDEAHELEHSLEVQLPFIQTVMPNAQLVPLLVGKVGPGDLREIIETVLDKESLLIVSSDLSHYLPYEEACAVDALTSEAISRLDSDGVTEELACGARPIRGLLRYAKEKGLEVETVCLLNSGDTAGDKSQVVGYGAWAFYESTRH